MARLRSDGFMSSDASRSDGEDFARSPHSDVAPGWRSSRSDDRSVTHGARSDAPSTRDSVLDHRSLDVEAQRTPKTQKDTKRVRAKRRSDLCDSIRLLTFGFMGLMVFVISICGFFILHRAYVSTP